MIIDKMNMLTELHQTEHQILLHNIQRDLFDVYVKKITYGKFYNKFSHIYPRK